MFHLDHILGKLLTGGKLPDCICDTTNCNILCECDCEYSSTMYRFINFCVNERRVNGESVCISCFHSKILWTDIIQETAFIMPNNNNR